MTHLDALVVEPDGSARIVSTTGELDELQALLNGGYLEPVASGRIWVAYADEDGLSKGLPPNPNASFVASKMMGHDLPVVEYVGPVIFLGLKVVYSPEEDGPVTEHGNVPTAVINYVPSWVHVGSGTRRLMRDKYVNGEMLTECESCLHDLTLTVIDPDGVLIGNECPSCGYYVTRYMPGKEPK